MSPTDDALALAAQAEVEAAEAEAQAAAARARVTELQARAQTDAEVSEMTEASPEADEADDSVVAAADTGTPAKHRISALAVGLTAVAAVLICALLAASGFMLWQGQQNADRQARTAEFAAAARQGVINLMSMDFNKGDADIKRLLDSTTGQFRADFENSQDDFLAVMKESKVVTKADVKATAVQSMTDNSAVVLVAASSEVSNTASNKQPPRDGTSA